MKTENTPESIASGTAVVIPDWWPSDSPKITKTFTHEEWERIKQTDEVLGFIERVNKAAVEKPYWSEDFRRALYDAFSEEHGKYAVAKYNNEEAFSISG
jgi:hypothetical protein